MHPSEEAAKVIEAVYHARRRAKGYPPESPEVRWIRRYMFATGSSQADMCKEMEMDQSYLSKIMSGKRQITLDEIGRLVDIIGPFPIDELDDYYKDPKEVRRASITSAGQEG